MDQNEETVWKNIQQKNRAAFEDYYKTNYKSFFLMACRYVKDQAQAEEIVNDVFLKLWHDGARLVISSSLKAYIYKAVINRSINVFHQQQRERQRTTDIGQVQEDGYELRLMEENELKVKLYAAVERLPEQCRRVFELSRFEGLKQQEIADSLGISLKTVKNHITIALRQLYETLEVHRWMLLTMVVFFTGN